MIRAVLQPFATGALEPQAEGVVVNNDLVQSLPQQIRLHIGSGFEQDRLVEVMVRLNVLREEPLLHGSQRNGPGDPFRYDPQSAGSPCGGSEFADGLVFEYLSRRQYDSLAPGSRHNLQAEDRVSPKLEEIVVNADFLEPQYAAPDGNEFLFVRGTRCDLAAAAFLPNVGRR